MNISGSGSYKFQKFVSQGKMGVPPEEQEGSITLTRFKKMSSTDILDKVDDNDSQEEDVLSDDSGDESLTEDCIDITLDCSENDTSDNKCSERLAPLASCEENKGQDCVDGEVNIRKVKLSCQKDVNNSEICNKCCDAKKLTKCKSCHKNKSEIKSDSNDRRHSVSEETTLVRQAFNKRISVLSMSSHTSQHGNNSDSSSCKSSPYPSSTHTPSSTPSSTPNSTPSPSPCPSRKSSTPTPPLDISDLLKVSEDILSHSPGKTLTLLQSHLEKGGSLLQEASAAGSEADGSVRELARALHLHLTQFTSRLHHTKDRLEDTARCYHLLDKAYEWALEAMKVVGRVKGEGMASPEQVGLAARALQQYLEEHPPIPDDTFTAMQDLATQLQNTTLLQQCKMAQSRCQETHDLLVSRQAALIKARRQMEFDCQSFVDLGEVMGGDGESASSPLAWLAASPLNRSGRRQSVTSIGSRGGGREPLSRCTSLDTDDDSVFMMEATTNNNSSQCIKAQLEPRNSLGGIKEVRESTEDLNNQGDNCSSSGSSSEASGKAMEQQAGTSGTSSCSSSDSCGPSVNKQKVFKRADTWQFMPNKDDNNEYTLESYSPDKRPVSTANSHLLIRSSQLNLSFNTDDLSQEELKKSKTLLMIMRELIQTERDYVNSLEYIIENYIPELMREDIPQAVRGQRNVIFGNIEKIYEFHAGYFLRALESCEMKPFSVGSIFLRYESQFYLYALYNKNKPKSDGIMSEYGTAFFRAKQLELEDRMDLASYVLKPVQRMGKYALILKQLLKECSRGEEGYEDLAGAADMVQFQLRHGNDLLAMDSLRDCDVNLKEQGRLLRQGEFVVWEGSRAKKSTRHIFLFEELILFSKARRDPDKRTLDIFQYKHSMKMTDMGLTEQVGESTTKFEIWFRKRKPSDTYLVQCANSDMKESWTEEISKLLWRQALRNRTMRLHEMSSMGIGNKPCLDIRPNRNQISDRSISINQLHKAPRLRSGSVTTLCESNIGMGKRPHSIISVSSSSASSSVASTSSSSSSSSAICPTFIGTLNLGFEPGDSPRALHRSVTRTSQCSAESGIMADMYSPSEDDGQSHRRVERSNSTITTLSVDSALSPASPLSLSPISATTSTPVSPSSPSSYYPSHPLLTSSMSCPKSSPLPSSYTVLYETPSSPPATPVTGPHNKTPKTLLTTEV